jgi:hypothetical protein
MNFIKKNYEKVLLSAVLLGLVGAVAFLPFLVAGEREALNKSKGEIVNKPIKPLPDLDLKRSEDARNACVNPALFKYDAPTHNLFNPVPWQKLMERLVKLSGTRDTGVERVEVTKLSPLYLVISLESVGASGSNYLVKVERQTATRSGERTRSRYVAPGEKTETFLLREARNTPDKPVELVVELNDTGARGTIAMGRPFRRVDGYTADLKYEPEKRTWPNKRVGTALALAGEDYVISAINLIASNQYEVVLSEKKSGKKTTIKHNAAP